MRLVLLLPLLLAAGPSPAELAPGPVELSEALKSLDERLDQAEAIGQALARVHNEVADKGLRSGTPACDAPVVAVAARSVPLGLALRDATQSARAQATRLSRIAEAPTAAPVAEGPLAEPIAADLARVEVLEKRWAEVSAWQASYLNPLLRKCKPALTPGEGLGEATQGAVAVLAVGGRRVCPMDLPAEGVVLAPEGKACVGDAGCDCKPLAVLPAAVLGP